MPKRIDLNINIFHLLFDVDVKLVILLTFFRTNENPFIFILLSTTRHDNVVHIAHLFKVDSIVSNSENIFWGLRLSLWDNVDVLYFLFFVGLGFHCWVELGIFFFQD